MPTDADYMREWRKTEAGQEALRRQKLRAKARTQALNQLAARHSAEFNRLLAAALIKLTD